MEDIMVKIDNVSKMYKLGQIGGTTIREELQRKMAKLRGKEDPTKVIGSKDYNKGETFMALNGVSFEVKKGERVGIIGHNGAGKSTLLKLLSRVTAPSSGEIGLNGRVTSMLEVGTGFHGELTGRENIYMNGAILGMTKKEIDAKMEDIIEFSECRQFIDTPVKRYSSGMYVKLAFSVAAHLDSEIMIMDEVLAVGDMAFQKKCLDKMNDVSKKDGRTILYVSHNMNTIRQLCDRVVVLDHGKVVFNGDVEEGIGIYMGINYDSLGIDIDLSKSRMAHLSSDVLVKITRIKFINKDSTFFDLEETINFAVNINSKIELDDPCMRLEIRTMDEIPVGAFMNNDLQKINVGINTYNFSIELDKIKLIPDKYKVLLVIYRKNEYGNYDDLDAVWPAFVFEVTDNKNQMGIAWNKNGWGNIRFGKMKILK